jgi:hypothetical protein
LDSINPDERAFRGSIDKHLFRVVCVKRLAQFIAATDVTQVGERFFVDAKGPSKNIMSPGAK